MQIYQLVISTNYELALLKSVTKIIINPETKIIRGFMSVIERIVKAIRPGASFLTPSGRSKFVVERADYGGIKLRVGQGWPISIKAECLEGIPSFLKGKGWVKIGATHGQPPAGSLDEYLQKFTYGVSAASYLAPILEKIGIVEVNRKRPYRIRLTE